MLTGIWYTFSRYSVLPRVPANCAPKCAALSAVEEKSVGMTMGFMAKSYEIAKRC